MYIKNIELNEIKCMYIKTIEPNKIKFTYIKITELNKIKILIIKQYYRGDKQDSLFFFTKHILNIKTHKTITSN